MSRKLLLRRHEKLERWHVETLFWLLTFMANDVGVARLDIAWLKLSPLLQLYDIERGGICCCKRAAGARLLLACE